MQTTRPPYQFASWPWLSFLAVVSLIVVAIKAGES